MASVSWKKCKHGTGEATAMMRHAATDERLKHEHANKQIDKTQTWQNFQIPIYGNPLEDFSFLDQKMKMELTRLDNLQNANKRKDRVEMIAMTIPFPEGICRYDNAREWASNIYDLMKERGFHMTYFYAHFDEVHSYYDPLKKEMISSRPHLHVGVIPEINDRLNAKKFTSKKNIISLNDAIEKMTKQHFPNRNFMTGEKRKSRGTVEELKGNSYKELQDAKTILENQIRTLAETEKNKKDNLAKIENAISDKSQKLNSLNSQYEAYMLDEESPDDEITIYKQTPPKTSVFGGSTPALVTISEEDYQGMKNKLKYAKEAARRAETADARVSDIQAEATHKVEAADQERWRALRLMQTATDDAETMRSERRKLKDRVEVLEGENSRLKGVIKAITDFVDNHFAQRVKDLLHGFLQDKGLEEKPQTQSYEEDEGFGMHM